MIAVSLCFNNVRRTTKGFLTFRFRTVSDRSQQNSQMQQNMDKRYQEIKMVIYETRGINR